MSKIDELGAAYAAATPEEWVANPVMARVDCTVEIGEVRIANFMHVPGEVHDNATFCALAHNNMPALLEAVKQANLCISAGYIRPGQGFAKVDHFVALLERLK